MMIIHQMYVNTTLLNGVNGVPDEEIYMNQPEGFVVGGHDKKYAN